MTTQTDIARELGISFDGVLMGKLDCYTDDTCTRSTLAVPIDSDLATVRAKLHAMRAKFADVTRAAVI